MERLFALFWRGAYPSAVIANSGKDFLQNEKGVDTLAIPILRS